MYLIIDVEATCWPAGDLRVKESEIIEFGAALVSDEYEVVGTVQRFVQPVRHPELSGFCTKLTTIRQAQVDRARGFPEALTEFREEIESIAAEPLNSITFCSWGSYDRRIIEDNCKFHGVNYPFGTHRNIKAEFTARGYKKARGMSAALKALGIPLQGTHHRGIDDAINIARIFILVWGGKRV